MRQPEGCATVCVRYKMFNAMRTAALFLALLTASQAQTYRPSEANLKARQWFQDAKFGLFIHWGVYSVPGDGEWVMNNRKMSVAEYEPLAGRFNPTEFDAAEWVRIAKAAGMRYITITSKHHDGFAMFATQQNKWNIADATPYHKDPLKMLAEECRKQGLKLFFYHSELDWHNTDYYPRGRTGHNSGRPEAGDFNRYLDFMDSQLRELLTNYGDVAGIWFDGWWDKPTADWRLEKTYALIHSLQPAALVGNNHHQKPFEGEDFQMFEKDLPGQNTAGFSAQSEVGKLPLESCDTISKSWGYSSKDKQYKSVKDLVHFLARAAGNNANFLLNIGPMPNGKIQPEFVERLRGLGEWTKVNGESIYGTRGGPVAPRSWGAMTQKPGKIYVHVLDWPDPLLAISGTPKVTRATVLATGASVALMPAKEGVVLTLPATRDPNDTVIVLETAR
jgi:alpha-L-fucosidase